MRTATVAVVLGLLAALAVLALVGLGVFAPGASLAEQWVSDTARDNEVNHHAVGVGPEGDVVVAPVTAVAWQNATLSETDCALVRLAPGDGSVLWRDGLPPDACFTHALTQPSIADVDGDGDREVIGATSEEALVVTDAVDGREQFRVDLSAYGYGRPTVANVTDAPGREIVASDIRGSVVLVSADGTVRWRHRVNESVDGLAAVWASPIVADVDADDDAEVVLGTSQGPVVLGPSGDVEWADDEGATRVAVGQGDADPALELFTAHRGRLRAVDGASGRTQWTRDVVQHTRVRDVADVDGTPTLFVGLANGTALAVDAETGETRWLTRVGADDDATLASPVLADVDGDGDREVVAAARDGTVAVLDPDSGRELAAYERSVPIWVYPTAADLDDDGADEVLVRYGDGRVVALAYDQ